MNAVAKTPIRGELRYNEALARHTTWRIGGPARQFFVPSDRDDLALFLAGLSPDEPVFWLGLGSNLLVRDGGLDATVICLKGTLDRIEIREGDRVYAEAGAPCPLVARFCADAALGGAEYLAGIPGTMGGALAMNAGALGTETWSLVTRVEVVTRRGEILERVPEEYAIAYRTVKGPVDEWFLSAELQLAPSTVDASRGRIKELLARRAATQPSNQPTCGSVFKNPPGDYAARLIEACGLKGYAIGAAEVSPKHANFIVNRGGASAADVEALIDHVALVVQRTHGVELQREVQIVGAEGTA